MMAIEYGKAVVSTAEGAAGGAAAKMAALPTPARPAAHGKAAVPAAKSAAGGGAARMAALPTSALPAAAHPAAHGKAAVSAAVEFPEAMATASLHFASCFDFVATTKHNLPHWGLDGAIVFVTFRLADSLPSDVLAQWREEREAWLAHHPEPWSEETARDYAAPSRSPTRRRRSCP